MTDRMAGGTRENRELVVVLTFWFAVASVTGVLYGWIALALWLFGGVVAWVLMPRLTRWAMTDAD